MKKTVLILMLALALLVISACGEESKELINGVGDFINSQMGQMGDQTGDGSDTQANGQLPDIDMSAIIGGTDTTAWGVQDEATKQAIINEAKKDGVDISFGADGSMTVKDKDGSVVVQKPDGTWSMVDEDGTVAQVGGNWPDNEFTRLLPKPPFNLLAASTNETEFAVALQDASVESIRQYVEQVKAKGFTIDAQTEDQNVMGMEIYSFTAKNTGGYTVTVSSAMGVSGITVTKP